MKPIHSARRHALRRWLRQIATLAGAAALGLALTAAWAGGGHDHDRARAAVEAGEILPLPALLEQLQRTNPGQVLALELEKDDGRWIYEIKLLQNDGRLVKLDVDARTAQVLKLEAKSRNGGRGARNASEPGQ
jgi:uncharacterized membrane protein YkoI